MLFSRSMMAAAFALPGLPAPLWRGRILATAISLLVALGIRRDGQKVVLAIKTMGGESEAAWRAVLDDLTARGMASRN